MHASDAKRGSSDQDRKIHNDETLDQGQASGGGGATWGDQGPAPHIPWDLTGAADTVSLDRFVDCLTASGLMSQEDVETFCEGLSDDSTAKDTNLLVRELIKNEKLTPYQAEVLRRGQTAGLVFGNYIVLEQIGAGGMGVVFKAYHRRMKRVVALKVLPPNLTSSETAIRRFHREVEAAAKLIHPNIVAAYDADEARGIHFLVMEYVEGEDLSNFVKRVGPLPLGRALDYTIQTARGLVHAHREGVVHRDIKPGNLLLDSRDTVKILDMGLARLDDAGATENQQTDLTQTGRVMGTVDYMAPEQALDAKRADHRADIYSLGCTLHYLLTASSLAPEGTFTQKLLWHQNNPVRSLRELCPAAPERLDAIFQRMLAKDPASRPESMQAVTAELEASLAELVGSDAEAAIAPRPAARATEETFDVSPAAQGAATMPGLSGAARTVPAAAYPTTLDGSVITAPPVPQTSGRRIFYIAAALLVALGAGGAGMYFGVFNRVPEGRRAGMLLLELEQSDAVVFIDNDRVDDEEGVRDGQFLHIELAAGRHKLKVSKEGFKSYEKEFFVAADGSRDIEVVLSPIAAPSPPPAKRYDKLFGLLLAKGGKLVIVTAEGPRSIDQAAQLETLPPGGGESLQAVDLADASVTDADMTSLAQYTELERLSLRDTAVSDAGLDQLQSLVHLTSLDLSGSRVTDKGLSVLPWLGKLRVLHLDRTGVTDEGLVHLSSLAALEELYLADTAVTDGGVKHLATLASLRKLTLGGTQVTATGLRSLNEAVPAADIGWDPADAQRALARDILQQGGALSIATRDGGVVEFVRRVGELPDDDLTIEAVQYTVSGQITPQQLEPLAGLESLKSLTLEAAGVSEGALAKLAELKQLRVLQLGRLPLEEDQVEMLRGALPECDIRWDPTNPRQIALWVIEQGGGVGVERADGASLGPLDEADRLPDGEFTLRRIRLDGQSGLQNDDLARLAGLVELTSLSLVDTPIGDAALAHLAGCAGLVELILTRTQVTDAGLKHLSRLGSLQELYLGGTQVTDSGLRALRELRSLRRLSVSQTGVTEAGLDHLGTLAALDFLDLSRTSLADTPTCVDRLASLSGVRELWLQGTGLSDAAIEELRQRLTGVRIQADPPDPQRAAARWVLEQGGVSIADTGTISQMPDLPRDACVLESVDFSGLTKFKGEGIERLSACTELKSLDLSGTGVVDDGLGPIAALGHLTKLSLAGTRVGDAGLAHLAGLSELRELDLQTAPVTDAGLKHLAGLVNLTTLGLAETRVTDAGLVHLKGLENLGSLNLSFDRDVTDRGMAHLEDLKKLQILILRSTQVGDGTAQQLARYKNLFYLDLSSTQITDAALEQLSQLKRLKTLKLAGTQITDAAASALGQLKTLEELNIRQTRIRTETAKQLQAQLPNCRIGHSTVAGQRQRPQ